MEHKDIVENIRVRIFKHIHETGKEPSAIIVNYYTRDKIILNLRPEFRNLFHENKEILLDVELLVRIADRRKEIVIEII